MFCLGLPQTLLNISHLIIGAMFFFFNSHTYSANSVQLWYFWCLKSLLWLLFLSLKVVSARQMYFFMSSFTAFVTVALYTSCDVKHSPFRGQLYFSFFYYYYYCFFYSQKELGFAKSYLQYFFGKNVCRRCKPFTVSQKYQNNFPNC